MLIRPESHGIQIIRKIFQVKQAVLLDARYSGKSVVVYRSFIGRLFKPQRYATLKEIMKYEDSRYSKNTKKAVSRET